MLVPTSNLGNAYMRPECWNWRAAHTHALKVVPDTPMPEVALGAVLKICASLRAHALTTVERWNFNPAMFRCIATWAILLKKLNRFEEALTNYRHAIGALIHVDAATIIWRPFCKTWQTGREGSPDYLGGTGVKT